MLGWLDHGSKHGHTRATSTVQRSFTLVFSKEDGGSKSPGVAATKVGRAQKSDRVEAWEDISKRTKCE